MEPSTPATNPTGLPKRLQRFKEVCLEKRALKGSIEKLIETREALAVRELENAESELERIQAKAAAIRSQMAESRLAGMADVVKSEEAIDCTSNGPPSPAWLSKTEGQEGRSRSLLDTSVVKGSTRTGTSFKSAESPVLSPSGDECSVRGSPDRTSFRLNLRSEDCTTTIPFAEEGGQSCDQRLELEAQQYAKLCEERLVLETEIEKELDDEVQDASRRVEAARSSLQEVRGKNVDILAGLKKASGEDTVIVLPPTLSVGGQDRGDGTENALPTVNTIQPSSSEAKAEPPASLSEASTHHQSLPSVRTARSPARPHFPWTTLPNPEEPQATGSQIVSLYKPRKKLHKRTFRQVERAQGAPSEDAAPLLPFVGGE